MRYLSRIIKSAKVSIVRDIDLDSPVVVKTEEIVARKIQEAEQINANSEKKEEKIVRTQEEIEAMYIEEARKKSELFFNTEMQRAYDEGMENARVESNNIIENAHHEADRIVSEAVQLKNNIADDYKKTMESMEKEILDLVLEVSKKVIEKEIEKPDYILGIVADALDKATSKKGTILKVSEEDYEFIVANKEQLLFNIEGFGDVEILKEASLEKGSCLVETNFGIIDGSLKTRMQQIEQEVYRILNR
jgi:flagellar assembly protein FliH